MTFDADRLLMLRVAVARVGEMDLARWWNTQGQLSALGASVLRRGFTRTHHFAQARSVFAVASHLCREIYDPPRSVTLWNLPAEMEDEFEQRWEGWLDDARAWDPYFTEIEQCGPDLEAELSRLDLVEPAHVDAVARLRRSAEGRAVAVPGEFQGSDDDLTVLALAFSRGEQGGLAVPYQAWDRGE